MHHAELASIILHYQNSILRCTNIVLTYLGLQNIHPRETFVQHLRRVYFLTDKRLPSRDELTATALSSTTITDHRENPAVKVSNEPCLTSTKSRTLGPSTYSTLQNPSSSQDLKNTNKQKRPMLILEESCTHRMNGKASTLPISGLKETRVPFNIQDRRPREDYLEEMQSEILKPEGGILTFETDVESKKYNRSKYTIDNEIRVNCELHDFVSTKNETPKTSDDLNSNRYSLVKRM